MKIVKANSFKCAFKGFYEAVRTEMHMKIHISIMIIVIIAGLLVRLKLWEWIICIFLFGAVLSAELFNTSIEKLADLVMPAQDERVRFLKDVSAAGVLIISIVSAVIGLLIFLPF